METKTCKRSEYRNVKTGRCRKLPTKIKSWMMERHWQLKKLGEVDFWRNISDKGFVSISKVERGAPAWEGGKNRYGVEINTPKRLDSEYSTKLEDARGLAVQWMEKYPKG